MNIKLTIGPFVCLPYADVDLSCIDMDDRVLLARKNPWLVAKTNPGFILYCPSRHDDQEKWKNELREKGYSERFIKIIRLAVENNIRYIRFDAEGETTKVEEPIVREGRFSK